MICYHCKQSAANSKKRHIYQLGKGGFLAIDPMELFMKKRLELSQTFYGKNHLSFGYSLYTLLKKGS